MSNTKQIEPQEAFNVHALHCNLHETGSKFVFTFLVLLYP